MKMLKTLIASKLLVLLLVSISLAQEKADSLPKRIALVSKLAFGDPKDGIEKLVKAWNTAESFCEFGDGIRETFKQIKSLENELNSPSLTVETKTQKQNELEELRTNFEKQIERRKINSQKRIDLIVAPVWNDINTQIKFISEQNQTLILNGDELEEKGVLLAFNEKTNITKSTISAINDYFKTGLKPSMNIDLSETKIALINTTHFEKKTKFDNDLFVKMRNFLEETGFHLILDSSLKLPAELKEFPAQDVTKDFISYYNQVKQ